jgi:gamma-glutamyl:cysteine ligase YbdK (ATP-grasp superfamily)
MRSSSCLEMSEVPLALRQGSAHELVSKKLVVLNDAEGGIDEIRAKVDAWGGDGGLRCRASGLHPQQKRRQRAHLGSMGRKGDMMW